ncbi:MAG: hypothetical protein Q9220_003011 [cf. Caloplaca sp. 1 TL-2023]
MQHSYQLQSPIVQRRSQSMALAPTAPMIDPNLEDGRLHSSQLAHTFAFPSGQPNNPHMMNGLSGNASVNEESADRALPSIEISDETVDQAYVDFIFYCNPAIPLDTDSAELKKGFRSPPMSDGKKFSPFTIYGLISRLENKDIKTWVQLVVELGVELPDPIKNQSTQKLQQYAVRLKHQIGESVRDGVPPEEDLALRALVPELRPKRGRRKADDADDESNPAKRVQHQRSTSADFFQAFDEQYSAHPSSAAPWSAQPQQSDAWAAAQIAIAPRTPSTGKTPSTAQLSTQDAVQQLRWKINDQENTPMTPYPQSAVTPRHNYSASPSFEEPKSANPAGLKSRSRKRHGPAVSSAWSNTSTSSGKLRGRPPSNRSITDGPFSTFPANPPAKESQQGNIGTPTQKVLSPPMLMQGQSKNSTASHVQPTIMVTPQSATTEQPLARRPSKLQLQVPEHAGGPVRLATPPRVLINGESNQQSAFSHERRSSADFFDQLDDVSEIDEVEEPEESMGNIDWKRRALTLKRKLLEKEEELKAMKRRVLDAVM